MQKILILGSSGFIGRNLKEQLKGYELLCPTHGELNLLDGESIFKYIQKNQPNTIINCVGNDRMSYKYLLSQFFHLIEWKDTERKIINFGSGAEYQNTDYGFAKNIINQIIQKEPNVYNLRLYGVFGKYEDINKRFLSVCCKSILENKSIEIFDDILFDYLYINDLVKIVDWFINNNPKYKDYNVCTSKPLKLSEWAKKIIKLNNSNININIQNNNSKIYSGNNEKLLDEYKIEFTPIEQSLKELFNYYKEGL